MQHRARVIGLILLCVSIIVGATLYRDRLVGYLMGWQFMGKGVAASLRGNSAAVYSRQSGTRRSCATLNGNAEYRAAGTVWSSWTR
jgi:hypothetical protein